VEAEKRALGVGVFGRKKTAKKTDGHVEDLGGAKHRKEWVKNDPTSEENFFHATN